MQALDGADRVERDFDRLTVLAGYALLFVSVFLFWWPALIAAAIAWARREGADPVMASHYDFQLKVFWGDLALTLLGLIALMAGGGVALWELWRAALASGEAVDWTGWGARAGSLVFVGAVLMGVAALFTLVGAGWGALRLVTGGRIGQSPRP